MTSATARVPSGIADVTPQWLTGVLGADVTDVRCERIAQDSGFSSLLYRLHIAASTDAPSTVIAKLPAQSEARGAMEMLGGYRRELNFYQRVARRAPIQTPCVYAARMAENSTDFVLVLEDLQTWENADHLAGLSMDQARMCIAQLAGLHAWSLDAANNAVVQKFPSLDTPIVRDLFLSAFAPGWQIYRDNCSTSVPPAVARYADRFADVAPTALTALTERSMLLHGDIRADNMFFDGDRLKLVDFQLTSRGAGAADIGYMVSQGLPGAVRRGHDEELVRHYLTILGRARRRRLLVRRRVAALPIRGRLPDGPAGHHVDRLGCDARGLARCA
jgi:Ecdysteroid kinase-like family